MFEDYVAQMLWDIDTFIRGFGGQTNDVPQYIDLVKPQDKSQKQPLTADQIKERVLEGLR